MYDTKIIAKPKTTLIVYGVIKGYIKKPVRFMLGTIFSYPRFIKKFGDKYPKDFLKSAAFMPHLYNRLQKRLNKEDAYEVTRAVFLTSALAVMQANFRFVEAERNFHNLVKYQQKTCAEGVTRNNKMEIIEQTDNRYRFKVTKCMFFKFFTEIEMPELTNIMCTVDNIVFNSYLPNNIVFKRGVGATMADGAKYCEFDITRKSAY